MDKKQFKELFYSTAKKYDFVYNYGNVYFDKPKMLLVLELQKSNYSELYYCNIKLGVRGWHSKQLVISKEVIKNPSGPFSERAKEEFYHAFDLENNLSDSKREILLNRFFTEQIAYLKSLMDNVNDLIDARESGKIYIHDVGFSELLKLKSTIRSLVCWYCARLTTDLK